MIVHKKNKEGQRFIDKLINNLPFELHIPGYQYCGPGTELKKRLAYGDQGINKLDSACKDHDIAYQSNQIGVRKAADQVLIEQAWQRVRDKDASLGEKASAYLVTNLMKLKSKLGMGLQSRKRKSKKKRKINLKNIINLTKKRLSVSAAAVRDRNSKRIIQSALKAARTSVKRAGGKRNVIVPRVLPLPAKMGGFLPAALVPIFAGLSAVGSLAGGTASIVNAVNKASREKKAINTHIGNGLYLHPHQRGLSLHIPAAATKGRKGKGLFLKPWKESTGYGLMKGRGGIKKTLNYQKGH